MKRLHFSSNLAPDGTKTRISKLNINGKYMSHSDDVGPRKMTKSSAEPSPTHHSKSKLPNILTGEGGNRQRLSYDRTQSYRTELLKYVKYFK